MRFIVQVMVENGGRPSALNPAEPIPKGEIKMKLGETAYHEAKLWKVHTRNNNGESFTLYNEKEDKLKSDVPRAQILGEEQIINILTKQFYG